MTPRLVLALISALALACAPLPNRPGGAPEGATSTTGSEELSSLRSKYAQFSKTAEALLKEQDELVWKSWTQGAQVDLAKPYQGKEGLFAEANLQTLSRLQTLTPDPLELRAVRRLRAFLAGEILSQDLAELTSAVENLRASMTFSFEGRELPWRELDHLMAQESSAARRRAIYAASQASAERLGQLVRRKDDQLAKRVVQLGYPSYAAFASDLREVDLPRMGALASRFLEITDASWKALLEQLALKDDLNPLELSRADLPRLLRPPSVEISIPKTEIQPNAETTFAGMRLSPKELTNLRVDWGERPGKNPGVLGLPVVVPKDIRASVLPAAGLGKQAEVLRELGRMLPYALSQPQPFPLQKLGSASVSEAVAALFADLTQNAAWLQAMVPSSLNTSAGAQAPLAAARAAQQLLAARLDAAHFLYELQLRGGEPQDPAALYSSLMSRAYGFPLSAADMRRADAELSDFFAPVDQFRTALATAELQHGLEAKFGATWWKRPETGAYLHTLLAKGNGQTAEEMVRNLTGKEMDAEALLHELRPYLKAPAGT